MINPPRMWQDTEAETMADSDWWTSYNRNYVTVHRRTSYWTKDELWSEIEASFISKCRLNLTLHWNTNRVLSVMCFQVSRRVHIQCYTEDRNTELSRSATSQRSNFWAYDPNKLTLIRNMLRVFGLTTPNSNLRLTSCWTDLMSVESQPTFRRNISSSSSGSKNKPSKKPAWGTL
jgi:hypothetical protein